MYNIKVLSNIAISLLGVRNPFHTEKKGRWVLSARRQDRSKVKCRQNYSSKNFSSTSL